MSEAAAPIWRAAPLGDTALLVEIDHADANRMALGLAEQLDAAPPAGLTATVPAIASLLLCFDPLQTNHIALEQHLHRLVASAEAIAPAHTRIVEIPVRYGGTFGPDLEEAAASLGLSAAELVTLHCAEPYRVMMIGFAPGFPYIGPLPDALSLPRRSTPRAAVPAGSVAIAAGLTGIYPARLPGGWHLIGHTELQLFDPYGSPPALLAPGDYVRFVTG